jgi:hypothetical protein
MENETNQPNNPKVEKLQMFAQSPELAMFDMLDEINNKLEEIKNVFKDLDLSKVEEIKGDKPEKGIDYFTEEEIEAIKDIIAEEVTPVKGVDYFDGEDADVDALKQELMMYIDEKLAGDVPTEDVIIEEPNPTLK